MGQIRDIMNKQVITISKEKTCLEAANMLQERDISFLVVVEGQNPVGIVTEADFVRKMVTSNKIPSKVRVADIMSPKYRWVEPTTTIEDAVQKMLNHNIRRLIVIEEGQLAGVITQTDLASYLRSKLLIDETVKNIGKDD